MSALGSTFGVLDEFFNPSAARAREELQHQKQQVIATPSPGDLLLKTGKVVITAPAESPVEGTTQ